MIDQKIFDFIVNKINRIVCIALHSIGFMDMDCCVNLCEKFLRLHIFNL